MKKFLVCLLAVCMLAFGAFAFTACDEEAAEEGVVTLVNISNPAGEISPVADFDYMVAAEPAVSAKVKGSAGNPDGSRLEIVGDLQELYGEDGYPQAVLVAKKSLIEAEPAFIAAFTAAAQASCEWVNQSDVDISAVVSAVQSHLPDDATPTFSANNLTADVIANCAIEYVSAANSKEDVTAFLEELSAVGEQTYSVADSFFYTGTATAGNVTDTSLAIDVFMPDGAPALSMAQLLSNESAFGSENFSYNVVAATSIQAYVTGNDPQAEIAVIPVNAAAQLLGTGSEYQMLATLTHGNIYILSAKHTDTQLTAENLSLLEGTRVGCIQLSNVVGLTLRSVLRANGIEYTVASDT